MKTYRNTLRVSLYAPKRGQEYGKRILRLVSMALAFALVFSLANVQNVEAKTKKKNIVVLYFSATGTTRGAAKKIGKATKGNVIEDERKVELVSETAPDWDSYETVFIGYPIWWGEAPHIVYSLVENVSLKKKTVIPFSTSISSGLGSSGKHLKAKAQISSKTKWMKGRNFYDVPSQKTVNKWVKSLKY